MSSTSRVRELSTAEKRALLAKLVRERGAAARGETELICPLIEAQAGRQPEAIAVVAANDRLSYAELNARANRLAHALRARGVGPETLVGLCVERSAEMVVGLLGILKAGGAYVPLDPAFPEARLALMLEDARPPVVVSQTNLAERLNYRSGHVLCLDADDALSEQPASHLDHRVHAKNLAYVIYTSGSTGKPKGVAISHGALANFVRSMRETFPLGERDALLAVTTLSFDIAALELFLPLVQGARVEIASRAMAADGLALADRMREAGITIMQATPATWRLLLESGWTGSPQLTILCGGEALPRNLADRLLEKGRAVWNLYGPTETTIWSTQAQVEPAASGVPIGQPIRNTQAYVLDARLRPVPPGVVGELYLGGDGVARGYWNRPALTADRFLPDPFSARQGATLYRTGDLARTRNDGLLECLGRVDHQVKIRGFRVELGEIESALERHPAVREAVVTAQVDPSGEQRLVAYLATRPEAGPAPAVPELRQRLMESLPDYMIPSAFVFLDALPRTPNGKVDRQALPAADFASAAGSALFVPPRGPIEESVAAIWRELLGRARIGVHDMFFDLGGHSLLAAQVLARVRDAFGVEAPLGEFLESPTVAGLSKLVEGALRAGTAQALPEIMPIAREGNLPVSFAQQRLWFLDQLEPGSASYNMPAAARLKGTLDVPALERALQEIIRRHETLRTTFAAEGGIPRSVIATELNIDFPVTDLSALPAAEREAAAGAKLETEAMRPFELATGPLLRAGLIRLSESEWVVFVVLHHIISDGWSAGVFIHEIAAHYETFKNHDRSSMADLPFQYVDYAAWQRGWLSGETLESHLEFWKKELGGVPVLELPTDRPRTAASARDIAGASRSRLLPERLVSALGALARRERATEFMALLAAFEVLLARYSGQTDFAVGVPVAGRSRSELEDMIGLFVNTLAIRAEVSEWPSFRGLLAQVRRRLLGALAHQDVPFDYLVDALHPAREAGRSPIFQVMAASQNAPIPALESPELTLEPLLLESGAAKFDLTLLLTQQAEGLEAKLEYRTALFDAATIDRMLAHLQTLLEAIVADPDRPVDQVSMLTEAERNALLAQGGSSIEVELESLSEDELDRLWQDLGGEQELSP